MTAVEEGPPEELLPHLRRMDEVYVETACDQIEALGPLPYGVGLECRAWRYSRTPHDAVRLTNSLWYWNRGRKNPIVAHLIGDIDLHAEECAGCPLPNKHGRRE